MSDYIERLKSDCRAFAIGKERACKERDELREALTQIRDGQFDGCYALMRDGKWHDLALALRDIAGKALAASE